MNSTVSASATIHAPPPRVYSVIADYRRHHPRIVPPEYFRKLEVLEGGVGAGTRTQVEMRVLGVTRRFVHVIREPQPGRVLEEADPDGFSTTTFTVEPVEDGAAARVTIQTSFDVRPGLRGAIERALTTWTLRRIYGRLLRTEIIQRIAERRIPGFRGIDLLRRSLEAEVEFVTIMWFDSLDAVRAFAGSDYEAAVVPPSARALLARCDARSAHYEARERRVV